MRNECDLHIRMLDQISDQLFIACHGDAALFFTFHYHGADIDPYGITGCKSLWQHGLFPLQGKCRVRITQDSGFLRIKSLAERFISDRFPCNDQIIIFQIL